MKNNIYIFLLINKPPPLKKFINPENEIVQSTKTIEVVGMSNNPKSFIYPNL